MRFTKGDSVNKWRPAPEELKEKFLNTMNLFEAAEKKKMFGYPCCFLNGNMFTGLHQENWVLRLSEADRKVMVDTYKVGPFEPMAGRIMKEYVILPTKILSDESLLKEWIEKSIAYASTLLPKVPKKRKK